MKFSLKIFAAIFSIAAGILLVAGAMVFRIVSERTEAEYIRRYQLFSKQVADTLVQADKTSDAIMLNALYVLREIEKTRGLPTNADLMKLKDTLGVENLYITDKEGKFIRSDWFLVVKADPQLGAIYGDKPLSKPLFAYCGDYKNLLVGSLQVQKTPIIPSGWPSSRRIKVVDPNKYLMIPNHNRTRILEAAMHVGAIGEIIKNAMEPDESINSIGLFAPSGDSLGYLDGKKLSFVFPKLGEVSLERPLKEKSAFIFFTKVKANTEECCECRVKGLTLPEGNYYYILRTEVSRRALEYQQASVRSLFLYVGIFGFLLSGLVAYLVSRHLVSRLAVMGARVQAIARTNDWNMRLMMPGTDEVAALADQFDNMLEKLKHNREQLAAAEREKAFVQLAHQVAHDIRSPLAALDAAASGAAQLPEQPRVLIRGAASRIRDIANHLLEKYKDGGSARPDASARGEPHLLSSLIDPIITEERLQLRDRRVELHWQPHWTSYGHFAKVEPRELKRVLSNLINNAVEAVGAAGKVSVSLAGEGAWARIEVRDNGRGIPADVLDRLGRKGQTFGKPGGSGLGLFHAKGCVELWSGTLNIASMEGRGTTVTLKLPQASSPRWFVSKLNLRSGSTVVVLDDDPTIHQVWQERLRSAGAADARLEVLHFSRPEELRATVRSRPPSERPVVYLMDHELIGYGETGLSLIEELGLGGRAILVTSRFEEPAILENCLRLGARMIPKSLAGFVPISIGPGEERLDAVLIDDDGLVRKVWQLAAQAKGKKIRVVPGPREFMELAVGISRDTPIYVDSVLEAGVRGQDFAKELHERGFTEISLCTGHAPESFPPMPWIKSIQGKDAPWS